MTSPASPIAETAPPGLDLHVLDGIKLDGAVNVDNEGILQNIRYSIRQQHPQVQVQELKEDRILLVGGGPSLNDTFGELLDLYMDGAKVIALNGAVAWLMERNIRPSGQIIVDARLGNERFITAKPIPNMRYLLASQCHHQVWDAVRDRENVWIWHAVDGEDTYVPVLNEYYGGLTNWAPIGGGTTAAMRGLSLLRTLGYIRYDLFGIDSCWMDDSHHAYTQPENDIDKRMLFHCHPTGQPEMDRIFYCAPWHVKQCEDLLQLMRIASDQFLINIHGDGMLAYVLQCAAADEGVDLQGEN